MAKWRGHLVFYRRDEEVAVSDDIEFEMADMPELEQAEQVGQARARLIEVVFAKQGPLKRKLDAENGAELRWYEFVEPVR